MFTVHQVVLVDNDLDGNAHKIQKLTQIGFSNNIKVSVNAGIALLYLQQQHETLKDLTQLIILNIDTPIMNGFEFLSELKNSKTISNQNIMVAVLKNNLSELQIDKLKIMGVTNFIDEDFCPDMLSKSVKKHFIKSSNSHYTSNTIQPQKVKGLEGLQGLYAA